MKNILFMCVANSARSQLAEGLAKKMFAQNAKIQSAGSNPGKLNPFAVMVLKENEVDISSHSSKSIDDLEPNFVRDLDYVITLCAEEVCPTLISKAQKLHWPFPDPAGKGESDEERLYYFRQARDAILSRLRKFGLQEDLL